MITFQPSNVAHHGGYLPVEDLSQKLLTDFTAARQWGCEALHGRPARWNLSP